MRERLWSDEEADLTAGTFFLLRRMRTAATLTSKPFAFRLRSLLPTVFGEPVEMKAPNIVLKEAQNLADVAGDFFAGRISETLEGTEYNRWVAAFGDTSKAYAPYEEATFSNAGRANAVGTSLIGRFRTLSIDPDYFLNYELTTYNHLGANSVDDLLDRDVGIISPLSGDYLVLSTYNSFLRRTDRGTLDVRAMAVSKDLRTSVLPTETDGVRSFDGKSEIAIYLDTIQSGSTSAAVLSAVKADYADKRVHQPPCEPAPWEMSKKIESFWKEYNAKFHP